VGAKFQISPKMWYLYILNCDNDYFYVGITTDLNNRLQQHQNGQSKFTKRFEKITLVYTEKLEERKDAVAREKEIKGWSRKKKQDLIKG
jgi:putative endonuclease